MKAVCENEDAAVSARRSADIRRSLPEEAARKIFLVFLAQLIVLALWSLPAQTGLVLVPPFNASSSFFGGDYFDLYRGTTDWLHGINPYLTPRIFTPPPSVLATAPPSFLAGIIFIWPPPSLLAGLSFVWLPFRVARFFFFGVDLVIIVASVRACSRRLGLSEESVRYLTGIALLFYPTFFLLERGNLEGLVLGCLSLAFCTRNRYIRAALVGAAGGLKLYPLLLVVPALRNKLWRFAFGSVIAFLLLTAPFYRLVSSFLHSAIRRGARVEEWTISPAGIIVAIAGMHLGRWIFLAYWAGTLALMVYRQRCAVESEAMWPFVPWMVSFPMSVYPYCGVLLLPVLAWKLCEMQGRKVELRDEVFIYGFLLVGIQAYALTVYAVGIRISPVYPIFDLMNSAGMCLILGSLAIPEVPTHTARTIGDDNALSAAH